LSLNRRLALSLPFFPENGEEDRIYSIRIRINPDLDGHEKMWIIRKK